MESKFHELDQDIINTFKNVWNDSKQVEGMNFTFIANKKAKELITVKKISELYGFLLDSDLLVTINEGLFNMYDEESIRILFEQETSKISVNLDNGKISINKPDVVTSSAIISKYGSDKVFRANQVDVLAATQNESLSV